MSIKAIKKVRERAERDRFDEGTVLRWTSGGRYTYVAVKTPVGWFTTGSNAYVPRQLDWESLLEILARSDVSVVEIARTWEAVEDTD